MQTIPPARAASLLSLLDDPSPVVHAALVAEFKQLGLPGIDLLRQARTTADPVMAAHALAILTVLQGPDAREEMLRFIRSMQYELETGWLMLNRVWQPDQDIVELRAEFDRIAARAYSQMQRDDAAWDRCKVLNRVLFHECGFRGNAEDFEDPLNSFPGSVLSRHKGIPISLSTLYILIADRCGLALEPIGLPGHFVVGCFSDDEPFYIDPYLRGKLIPGPVMAQALADQQPPVGLEFLAPTPVGEVLWRFCRNLQAHYTSRNNPAQAAVFGTFVAEFAETYRKHTQT
jgi:regulator of sirC expression with transglutaminase-like and TPR domain